VEQRLVGPTFCFMSMRFCILHHFLLSGEIRQNGIDNFRILHDVDIMFDPDPLELCIISHGYYLDCRKRIFVPHTRWVEATELDIDNYLQDLSCRLENITILVDTLLCNDVTHLSTVDPFAQDLNNALTNATKMCIPLSCNRQTSKCMPRWSEYIQPLWDNSLLWHRLWTDCERPRSGVFC
jgi:hypothetical protein